MLLNNFEQRKIEMETTRDYVKGLLPITMWTKDYSQADFIRDFVGGLQISTILIPQAMSYSLIASLPPEYGLYSVVISGIVHVLFGISPYQSIGPFAVTSLITGGALLTTAVHLQQDLVLLNILPSFQPFVANATSDPWVEYPIIIPLSELFTLMISLMLLLIFITNAGKILSKFLPKELVAGFTSAAAISIMISQLKQLFGIRIPTVEGSFVNFKTLYLLARQIQDINLISLSMGILTILVIIFCEFIEHNLTVSAFKWTSNETTAEDKSLLLKPGSIPTMLISILIPTLISYLADLPKLNLSIIGKVPRGLPSFNLPWRVLGMVPSHKIPIIFLDLLPKVLAVALVSYVALLSILQEFPVITEEIVVVNNIDDSPADIEDVSPSDAAVAEDEIVEVVEIDSTPTLLIPTTDQDTLLPPAVVSLPLESPSKWSVENNELFSLVLANLFVPFASGYVVSPSLSRSAILATQLRTKTPLGNFIGCLMIMVTCFALTDMIYHIPLACLSGLVIISLKSTLMKVVVGKSLFMKGGVEFKIWLVTFLTVVVIDPASGIMAGMLTCAIITWVYPN